MPAENELAFGIHAIQSLLDRRPELIDRIYVDNERKNSRIAAIAGLAKTAGVRVQHVPREKLNELAGRNAVHQGVVARIRQQPTLGESDIASFVETIEALPFILVLDGVQDPHNLGACLRTAAAVGVHGVVVTRDNCAPLNATVRKAASGALESLNLFQVTNLARVLGKLKQLGIWLIGAAGDADSDLYQSNFNLPVAIVLGSEGKGLRKRTRDLCDSLVRIPVSGGMESLNVSVATGICLYEVLRQRRVH